MRNGIDHILAKELAAKGAQLRRWMYYCGGVSLACVVGVETLRIFGRAPGGLASALGVVFIYSFGALVFLYILRRDLKKKIELLGNEMNAVLSADEPQGADETDNSESRDDPRGVFN